MRTERERLFGWIALAPLAGWAQITFGPAALHVDYWTYLTRDFFGFGQKPADWPAGIGWPVNNLGHLWFLEHLLIYATLYAGLRVAIAAPRRMPALAPPSHGAIAAYAVALAAATFVIRIWYPQDRWIGFLGYIQMEPAHLPQYASLFVIGVLAWPRRWIETMPTRRGLVWLAIGVGLALAAYLSIGLGVIPGFNSQDWRLPYARRSFLRGRGQVAFSCLVELNGGAWRVRPRSAFDPQCGANCLFIGPISRVLGVDLTRSRSCRRLTGICPSSRLSAASSFA